jgi:hypothetical protein
LVLSDGISFLGNNRIQMLKIEARKIGHIANGAISYVA